MKTIFYLFATLALVFSCTGCVDRDIIDSKDGVSLPPVTNLNYTLSGKKATLTWTIPSSIPTEMKRPLSVQVQVLIYRPGILSPLRKSPIILENEASTATVDIPTEPGEYHAIVKLTGAVAQPVYGESSTIYSLGQSVILK